jgi:predicted Rossmann-fold nucleotide-binding protein
MIRRRCIVGVIGGDDSNQVEAAQRVGEAIARAGQIILTGGEPKNTNEVKNAVLWGAAQAEEAAFGRPPVHARMVGILKSSQDAVDWNDRDHPCRLILKTGLTSFERDPINGLTPDALIVFQGGRGTLCELAYAAAANMPIRYYRSIQQLRNKAAEHLGDGVLKSVFGEALEKYSVVRGRTIGFPDLIRELSGALDTAQSDDLSPEEIVRASVEDAFQGQTELGPVRFPGLWGDVERSKVRFESIAHRICRCGDQS